MKEYVEREKVRDIIADAYKDATDGEAETVCIGINSMLMELQTDDVVPWSFLERYADYFCAVVSMPEFIREAKMFYESTNRAMEGGNIV